MKTNPSDNKPSLSSVFSRTRAWLPSILALAGLAIAASPICIGASTSQWVYPGPDGKLVYKTTPAGDKIMDFSSAGYMGGGVALPDVPVKATVKPSGGRDDTADIQAAIAQVAAMPLVGRFHGAVLLESGTFTCSRTIALSAGGVVLRGSGSGKGGTTIKMVGGKHGAFSIGGGRGPVVTPDTADDSAAAPDETVPSPGAARTSIADAYVPAGTTSFSVASAKGFAVGDTISIQRPTTTAWTKLMGMDTLNRAGGGQKWLGTRAGVQQRKITAISGNQLTVGIPLADSYDAKYLNPPGTTVAKVQPTSRTSQVGIERLHVQCPPLETAYGQAPYSGVQIAGDDCWVKDVYFEETMNTTKETGKRITLQEVVVKHTYPNLGASKPTDFSIESTQILLDRCEITGDNMYFVWTASLDPGPNVLLNCTFRGRGSRIQPHMRWSTGMLVDNCSVPDGGIDFANRGVAGSGHGWTMGWAVAWNCLAKTYVIQTPPGSANWAIGCIGQRDQTARYFDTAPLLPEGFFDSHGAPVAPQSLYLAQLSQRLGPQAIKNIGYDANQERSFANKSVPLLKPWVNIDDEFGVNQAFHRPVNAAFRGPGRQFAGEKAVDGDPNTYWTVNEGTTRGSLEIDTEGPVEIDTVVLSEPPGSKVASYRVEGVVNSRYKLLAQGTTIGQRKVDRFPKETVWKVRLTVTAAGASPAIQEIGLYLHNSKK